jgi:enterochelin esterase-like enzyme
MERLGRMLKTLIWFALVPLALHAQEASPVITLPEMPPPTLGPDSQVKEGVPKGTLTEHLWKDSKVFPATIRSYSVYVPAQVDASKPSPLIVFQDGHAYANPKGDFRVPTVLDNLIHAGEIPPMIAIFINPGDHAEEAPKEPWKSRNRSVEYDTLSDAYARFLLDEILPEVGKTIALTRDPEQRAICGMSSGGICAWTVAWQRPDAFRKVISQIGSFTNIRGGDAYPGLIRKTPKKPIRAFFQEGINDLDNTHGSWPLGNLQMEAALKFSGYDYRYVWGDGAHNGKHGGAIFPESMRWLWRN